MGSVGEARPRRGLLNCCLSRGGRGGADFLFGFLAVDFFYAAADIHGVGNEAPSDDGRDVVGSQAAGGDNGGEAGEVAVGLQLSDQRPVVFNACPAGGGGGRLQHKTLEMCQAE